MTDEFGGVYAVIIETKGQAPILLETEGDDSSRGAAVRRYERFLNDTRTVRACVVQIVPDRFHGNQLLIHDMQRLQKVEMPDD